MLKFAWFQSKRERRNNDLLRSIPPVVLAIQCTAVHPKIQLLAVLRYYVAHPQAQPCIFANQPNHISPTLFNEMAMSIADQHYLRKHTPVTLEQNYTAILGQLGEDVSREGLLDTPKRAAKAMQYLCRGYEQTLEEVTNGALFSSDASEMVMVKDIELYSLCEHHLLPFIGKAHVAYIPNGKVLGLSKVARIVDMYARRLQIQENLSRQIAEAIMQVTGALGVAVVIEAKHMCMMMRGVEKQNSSMITSVMLGEFRENAATRMEFLGLIK